MDPRAILGLFSLHPAECSRHILVRHAGRVCISYDTKTSHYFPLSLDRSAQSLPSPSYSSPPRGARGHVTTIMPVLFLSCPDLPLVLLLVLLRNLLPSFVLFPIPLLGYLLPQITYPLNETKAMLAGDRLINYNATFALERFLLHVFPDSRFLSSRINLP